MNRFAACVLVIACLVLCVDTARAQLISWPRGYYLNVPLWSEQTALNSGGLGDLQRLRLMAAHRLGPISIDVAYEQSLSYSQRVGLGTPGSLTGALAPGGITFLDLDWTLGQSDHFLWQHRLDRLNFSFAPFDFLEVTVGRQTISWATTLLLTPADPFVPFDPADPFREYRAGVDAVRVQLFPGPLADVDLVLRASDTPVGKTVTLLGRASGVLLGWEISGWAGALHDEPAVGAGATGSVGQVALRLEASLREDDDGEGTAVRGTVGIDTRFELFDRDLYVAFEYQHDDFGASTPGDFSGVVFSKQYARSELQVLGRDETLAQAVYGLHPLLSIELMLIGNLNDGSALLAPGLSYSVSNESSARLGVFFGAGSRGGTNQRPISSEFGLAPSSAYASMSFFF